LQGTIRGPIPIHPAASYADQFFPRPVRPTLAAHRPQGSRPLADRNPPRPDRAAKGPPPARFLTVRSRSASPHDPPPARQTVVTRAKPLHCAAGFLTPPSHAVTPQPLSHPGAYRLAARPAWRSAHRPVRDRSSSPQIWTAHRSDLPGVACSGCMTASYRGAAACDRRSTPRRSTLPPQVHPVRRAVMHQGPWLPLGASQADRGHRRPTRPQNGSCAAGLGARAPLPGGTGPHSGRFGRGTGSSDHVRPSRDPAERFPISGAISWRLRVGISAGGGRGSVFGPTWRSRSIKASVRAPWQWAYVGGCVLGTSDVRVHLVGVHAVPSLLPGDLDRFLGPDRGGRLPDPLAGSLPSAVMLRGMTDLRQGVGIARWHRARRSADDPPKIRRVGCKY